MLSLDLYLIILMIQAPHLAKHNRRKYINLLEKIMKNMFRLFRDETSSKEEIIVKFNELNTRMDKFCDTHLDSEYHRAMIDYVQWLATLLRSSTPLDENIRSKQMSQLNRIQKIKNQTSYKREKIVKDISFKNT